MFTTRLCRSKLGGSYSSAGSSGVFVNIMIAVSPRSPAVCVEPIHYQTRPLFHPCLFSVPLHCLPAVRRFQSGVFAPYSSTMVLRCLALALTHRLLPVDSFIIRCLICAFVRRVICLIVLLSGNPKRQFIYIRQMFVADKKVEDNFP